MNPRVAALIALAALTLIKATPLIFAALGGVLSERSGVVNIGLEGIMVGGAFFAVCVSGATGSPLLGALAGIVAGALLAASARVRGDALRIDQIVAGTGLNIVALGAAAFGLVLVFGQPGARVKCRRSGTGNWVLTVLAFVLAGGVVAVPQPHAVGTARARVRRKSRARPPRPGSIRCAALLGRRCGRRDRGARRRVPLARRIGSLLRRHDCRPRLHRACRRDLRPLDAVRRNRGLRLLRILLRFAIRLAGNARLPAN